jgi:hypothetical protein
LHHDDRLRVLRHDDRLRVLRHELRLPRGRLQVARGLAGAGLEDGYQIEQGQDQE